VKKFIIAALVAAFGAVVVLPAAAIVGSDTASAKTKKMTKKASKKPPKKPSM